ncbi:hypothetical protein NliqN6_6187 [Naganishia liquefaciens]|uniref:ABC1 atypical kinase-like domain-containing protein n=1 Tax=Naganishia liquefaciens TaxID=104408 RepID=A0A8H3YHB3_9TREE|nr:hypothetical protein NliqN6_6187 [Naganishia liquefaciens]
MSSRITLLRARVPLPSIHSALNRHASPSTAYPAFKNAHGPTQPQRYASSVERNAAKTLNELPKKDASPSNESANQKKSRFSRFSRFALVSGVVVWVGVEVDKRYNSAAITRSIRTGWMGPVLRSSGLPDKWNFTPSNTAGIDALHERVAGRLHSTVMQNQGLYIKMGQAIGLQASLLPKPYKEAFANIFDAAPNIPIEEIQQVFREDFAGKVPNQLFTSFSETPIASASIAQVHEAVIDRHEILPDGSIGKRWQEKVAVKVQKPAIRKQMEWDLWSYRTLMYLTEKLFAMPMYFVADYVSQQMRLETNFMNEATNAQKCAEFLASTPELKDKVYVPKIYNEVASSERVMVMEYVKGCRITDRKQIEEWGFNAREVMDTVISCMSAMTFKWGFIHCDPHPGNILVRPHPSNPKKPQVVLLDHGLYITLSDKFKSEYCRLWRSLFTLDTKSIEDIALKWGIQLPVDLFASAILLRPFQVDKRRRAAQNLPEEPPKSEYEQQVELKQRLRNMLANEALIPRELIFITRNQRMSQANNQTIGSLSPRINITAHVSCGSLSSSSNLLKIRFLQWAARGYKETAAQDRSLRAEGLKGWLQDRRDNFIFGLALLALDANFWTTRFKQWWYSNKGKGEKGWEDNLQAQFEKMAKDEFGIDLQDDVFLG